MQTEEQRNITEAEEMEKIDRENLYCCVWFCLSCWHGRKICD